MRRRARSAVARLKAGVAAVPNPVWALCAGFVVVLVAVPALIAARRATEFSASLEVFVLDTPPQLQVREPATDYVRRLVGTKVFETETARRVANLAPDSVAGRLTVEPTERSVLVTASAPTPDDALALAASLNGGLSAASRALLRARARAELVRVRQLLEREGLTAPDREDARRREQRLAALAVDGPPQVAFGPPPERVAVTRVLDRAAERLPGPFPANPGPLRAGLAGLVAALVACGVILLTWRRRANRRLALTPATPVTAAPAGDGDRTSLGVMPAPVGGVVTDPQGAPMDGQSSDGDGDAARLEASALTKATGLVLGALAGAAALRMWRRR
jgi:hypothetical protein